MHLYLASIYSVHGPGTSSLLILSLLWHSGESNS